MAPARGASRRKLGGYSAWVRPDEMLMGESSLFAMLKRVVKRERAIKVSLHLADVGHYGAVPAISVGVEVFALVGRFGSQRRQRHADSLRSGV